MNEKQELTYLSERLRRLEHENAILRGAEARKKVELQNSNRGVARLSARVQRLKGRVAELETALGVVDPAHPALPQNRKREPWHGQGHPEVVRAEGGMVA